MTQVFVIFALFSIFVVIMIPLGFCFGYSCYWTAWLNNMEKLRQKQDQDKLPTNRKNNDGHTLQHLSTQQTTKEQ